MEAAKLSGEKTCCHKVVHDAVEPSARFAPFIQSKDNHHSLTLGVDGMHCARCIWAIESTLKKEEAVTHARVNLSTRRLHVEWVGEIDAANAYAKLITDLGYRVFTLAKKDSSASEEKHLLRCLAVAGFGMANLMLISVALWSSTQEIMGMMMRDLFHWASAIIAIPVIAYSGRPFFGSAWSKLKHFQTNMDVPISLALILATGMSVWQTIRHAEDAYFDSAVMLVFFLLIGRWLDVRARGKARANAQDLLDMMQGTATILEDGNPREISIQALQPGMMVRVATGERVPTDAIVVSGISEIDMSLVTGESVPQTVEEASQVYGGTINLSAPILCEVSHPSEGSLLADIVRLMEASEEGRKGYVRLADKAAQYYTPVVHSLAALAFAGWYFIGGIAFQDALLIAITTLIITCPCALGLAVPVVQVLATSTLMRKGILVKTGDALERLARIDTVMFDKTGTLTQGKPSYVSGPDDEMLQRIAVSLASHSHHPLSQALLQTYEHTAVLLTDVEEVTGMGVQAIYDRQEVRLGRRSWCGDSNHNSDTHMELWLSVDGEVHRFCFADELRDDARSVVKHLVNAGMEVHLLSGDRQEVAQHIAVQVGIDSVKGDSKPDDKVRFIEQAKSENKTVLMVGDGLNDAPALTEASISMSPSSAIDMAQNAADIIFQGDRLEPVLQGWHVARKSTRLIKQNFGLSIAYNIVAVPIALMGLVNPLIAALAMSSSSLLVILNAFRIHKGHEKWMY